MSVPSLHRGSTDSHEQHDVLIADELFTSHTYMYYIEQLSCTSVPFFFLAGGSAGIFLVTSARGL